MSDPDPILTDAMSRRDAALADARRWGDFIQMYVELKPDLAAYAAFGRPVVHHASAHLSAKSSMTATATGTRQERPQRADGALAETEAATIRLLQGAGRSMQTRELLERLAEIGVVVGGKDPPSTLSARLSRAPSLENVRPHGWRIREDVPKGIEATDSLFGAESVAPGTQPPAADDRRTEVEHNEIDNIV